MTESTQFAIGTDVACADGPCGEVIRVVVDSASRVATHLVVEAKHRTGLGRLVPLDLVSASDGTTVTLSCSLAEFDALDSAEQIEVPPGMIGRGSDDVPYFVLGAGNTTPPSTVDTLPPGEVAIRPDEPVHATDGEIGRVEGLVVDGADHRVTHVLLQEGHLWGRKDVAIPIDAVTRIGDGVWLKLTKGEIERLPAVEINR